MLKDIANSLFSLVESLGYLGLAISMFVENIFPPIPSELILPMAGILAAQGKLNVFIAAIVAGTASYIGTLPFYYLGRVVHQERLEKLLDKYGKYLLLSSDDLRKGFKVFDKYGKIVVLIGRLIPVIRTIISVPAGSYKMNFTIYTIYTLIGSILWSFVLIGAGFLLGENGKNGILDFLSKYEKVVIVLIVLLIAVFVAFKLKKLLTKKSSNQKEI